MVSGGVNLIDSGCSADPIPQVLLPAMAYPCRRDPNSTDVAAGFVWLCLAWRVHWMEQERLKGEAEESSRQVEELKRANREAAHTVQRARPGRDAPLGSHAGSYLPA